MEDYSKLERYLTTFLKNEVEKNNFKNVVLGLSGGLDSAVVAVLLQKVFGKNLTAIMMPNATSNQDSLNHAKKLCKKFHIDFTIEPIDKLVDAYFKDKNPNPLQMGNFSARMRMSILYDISAKLNALVIGTSNKSELLLGYGTIHGDLACAINPIGDIYKSDLFGFASHLGVIEEIINKAPSADLWEGQSDEEELGFSYEKIDEVLRDFIDQKLSYEELLEKGYDKNLINMITKRFYQNQFKRQLPIIAKLDKAKIKSA
ncbi:MAG: NAD(+) synthetase [Proteobacteria bacterium]|nr:MAG: NAD(+) synthetase [Pseudomonadota bacterium]